MRMGLDQRMTDGECADERERAIETDNQWERERMSQ